MRLFIAVEIPEDVSDVLHKIQDNFIPIMGCSKTRSFHLTLKFLGDVDQKTYSILVDKLSQIKFDRFQANISEVGTFPNPKNPRVLWVGVEPHDAINSLQQDIDEATRKLGFRMDKKFHPHLTLARIKFVKDKDRFTNLLKTDAPQKTFPVSDFRLIKSTLTPQGPEYEVLETFSAQP